ncbi:PhzF family phenazine biosynthesis protein [Polyangium jinanense]|uniref:PhzF family phenazine biosynthesis protein n=1 Tax=Polyangium jinanense TaxID=2829994 RepID=A0A9X4AQE6_9BACT|nr:PhzF family phenazine biosynthesis protein [Polyangium jinanense]MDC3953951.1 PhzF family phenazine biosynthesis protein [Polyangium jinanense]MDC3957836.1 PhzF family phenazine biosynthesis protein [Polyangium jinanense]MDC3978922.1 PhzF family phenazine biosynthesis protein [Polyangium jinanense]MDC3982093.1 PhzF family phenazine biosynthesis protein [Polyangium jinanense]
MTEIPLYQIDAFTLRPFAGNPAAVCPLPAWLPDETLQAIAAENNLSETAFIVRKDERHELRWFTPSVEVDLCGHATLAAGYVVLELLSPDLPFVSFHTRSGQLVVRRAEGLLSIDLPARPPAPTHVTDALAEALGKRPIAAHAARDIVAVYESAEDVRALRPDMAKIAALETFAVGVTAKGTGIDADVDFVSRFFAPAKGVPEDPVTGSLHCTLVPLWASTLGRARLRARQVSARGGELDCTLAGDRVLLAGGAVLVIEGRMRF